MKPNLQHLRHGVQFLALLFILATPLAAQYGRYLYNHQLKQILEEGPPSLQRRAIELMEHFFHANAPSARREHILEGLQNIRGNHWSAQVFGVSLTDPLGGIGSAAASRSITKAMLIGIAVPVIVTLLLGRVFCSWLCPIGFLLELSGKFRCLLSFLKIPPKNVFFWRGTKYILLITGLIVSAFTGAAVLNEIYPPALMSREIHNAVSFLFEGDLSRRLFEGLTGISILLVLIVIVELFVSERLWCRYLCPGGALYSLLGYKRFIRVQRQASQCNQCAECIKVCGMGLNPMKDAMGNECDNCLACVRACGQGALSVKPSRLQSPAGGRDKSARKGRNPRRYSY